jgi:hypothetical protein
MSGKAREKDTFENNRLRWVDNIQIYLGEVGCGGMDWIGLYGLDWSRSE